MSLSAKDYENYKNQLASVQKEITTLEAKQEQSVDHLKKTFGLTPEEAKEELLRLETELPELERHFETQYQEFLNRWGKELKIST